MFNNAAIIRRHQAQVHKELKGMVTVMANDVLNHSKDSFRNQGFIGDGFEPWKRRKTTGDRGRGLLIKTGDLRRSLAKRVSGYSATISSDKPYAQIHNDGLMGKAWGKHTFQMPKRQFVGYSEILNRRIINKFHGKMQRIFGGI